MKPRIKEPQSVQIPVPSDHHQINIYNHILRPRQSSVVRCRRGTFSGGPFSPGDRRDHSDSLSQSAGVQRANPGQATTSHTQGVQDTPPGFLLLGRFQSFLQSRVGAKGGEAHSRLSLDPAGLSRVPVSTWEDTWAGRASRELSAGQQLCEHTSV